MDIEHIAFQVSDPVAAAEWYALHLGLRIVWSGGPPGNGRFVADSSGHVMIELYHNPAAPVPDYRSMDPVLLHLAMETDDVPATRTRLIAAGATAEGDITHGPTGDVIAVVRDPWGFPLQLCRRARPMI
jgi:glyoxylase I family protein